MLPHIPKNNEEREEMHLLLEVSRRNIRSNTGTLTRYHCFVKRGSFMLMSISLMFLYPRFFRSNPSCCKTIFTWNDNTGILPEYQLEHPSSGIHFQEFKLHLHIRRFFFVSAEATFILYALTFYDDFPRAFTSACFEQTGLVIARSEFP